MLHILYAYTLWYEVSVCHMSFVPALIFMVQRLLEKKGEGWDPANMFNPATFCMYVPVSS